MFQNGPEYWKLRRVIMYKPGDEISIVNKDNCRDYLFREPVDLKLLVSQFENYVDTLKGLGVEVLLLNDLFQKAGWKPRFIPPNLFFMRDVMAMVDDKIIYGSMKYEARRLEPYILRYVFEKLGWKNEFDIEYRGAFEGGDLLYLNEKTVMIGYGPRTSYTAAYQIGRKVVSFGFDVILVSLPSYRVHLDGGMMVLDKDLIVAHTPSIDHYPSLFLYRDGGIEVESLYRWLLEEGYTFIGVDDDESRTFGANNVVVKRGRVLAYSWNHKVIREMESHGIDVIPINAPEIMRGSGGLHCLFNALYREH